MKKLLTSTITEVYRVSYFSVNMDVPPFFSLVLLGPSRSGRKRNLSLEEFNDSTSNKKARVASSEQQKEDLSNQTKEAEGNCSWQGNAKKAGHSKHTHSHKKNEENLALQTNSVKQEPIKRTQVKRKSPLKRTHEKTPENPQASLRKDKHAQKKLNLDVIESAGEQSLTMKDAVAEGSSSEESSDDETVAWEDVDGMLTPYAFENN